MKSNSYSISKITACIIFLTFGWFFSGEVKMILNDQNKCLTSFDGLGYYMYLPHLLQKGNLHITQEWVQNSQNEYCNGTFAYQVIPSPKGGPINIYHMGQAYLEAPSFLIGHFFAKILGYKTDGFSKPYHLAFTLNGLLFIALGIFYFRKLCLHFFSEKTTVILLIAGLIGTNYWATATYSYSLQHLYLFALIAAFAYFFFQAVETENIRKKQLILSAIIFGLCVAIRPTHVLLGVMPGIVLLRRFGLKTPFWKAVYWYPVFAFIWCIPQFYYWKTVGNQWILPNLHTEDLTFFDPYTYKFLLSYRKGWLIYTPLFFLLVPGFWFVYTKKRALFWPLMTLTVLFIWTFSSWECWWYASSFGQRTMVDLYPILLIPVGFLIENTTKKVWQIVLGIVLLFTTSLSTLQTWQIYKGILPLDGTTSSHYWYVFGKTSIDNFQNYRAMFPKADTSWVQQIENAHDPALELESINWFTQAKPIVIKPNSGIHIVQLPFFGKLKTDETLLTFTAICESTDTTQSVKIQFEAAGPKNHYSWDNLELSLGNRSGKNSLRKVFNIPDVRHANDCLKIYVVNTSSATINIEKIELKATSLIRK